jgi:N-acetylmuramic acid 6-phosphate etherase
MSTNSPLTADEFLAVSSQFRLGELVTESSHPITANLSEVAAESIADALRLLFEVDRDVLRTYDAWSRSGQPELMARAVVDCINAGGNVFFTGCGATGRLSILLETIWRDFWQRHKALIADRFVSVMAGGDYALVKSVEGFEDFAGFGRKQIADAGVREGDVVFAITEGGETSFVIGTAWQALQSGARVFFVYNNPDDLLRRTVERSREVIDDPRIEKVNLTTGPMAITGSTRMQATTIQLCAMLTVLEMALRELVSSSGLSPEKVTSTFRAALAELCDNLRSPEVISELARLVYLEETAYRFGHKSTYFADRLAVDVLTDTTERSPTFSVPPFRKFDDQLAAESWAFLFVPEHCSEKAWRRILKREPHALAWSRDAIARLVDEKRADRQHEVMKGISRAELLRFRIGLDGMPFRPTNPGDCVVFVTSSDEAEQPFFQERFQDARHACAGTGHIAIGSKDIDDKFDADVRVELPMPNSNFLLDPMPRIGAKMLLNALSTCVMVRLGRVTGNYMTHVVPSNLRLIDRATRYVRHLAGIDYEHACRLVFGVMDYLEQRRARGETVPPVVGLAVVMAREGANAAEAENMLSAQQPRCASPDEQVLMIKEDLSGLPVVDLPPGYWIRTFEPGDEPLWENLIAEAFGLGYDKLTFEQRLRLEAGYRPRRVLFMFKEDEPVATASAWFRPQYGPETGYLHMVAVREHERGQGLGYQISLAALHEMASEGRTSAVLKTELYRLPAIRTYLKLGFEPWIIEDSHRDRWQRIFSQLNAS